MFFPIIEIVGCLRDKRQKEMFCKNEFKYNHSILGSHGTALKNTRVSQSEFQLRIQTFTAPSAVNMSRR